MASPEPKRDLVDGDDLEQSISTYKDYYVTGVKDVPDQAALVTANISGIKLSPEENKRLVRKIDRWLMPLLCFVYMIQFVCFIPLRRDTSPSRWLCTAPLGDCPADLPSPSSLSPFFPPSIARQGQPILRKYYGTAPRHEPHPISVLVARLHLLYVLARWAALATS